MGQQLMQKPLTHIKIKDMWIHKNCRTLNTWFSVLYVKITRQKVLLSRGKVLPGAEIQRVETMKQMVLDRVKTVLSTDQLTWNISDIRGCKNCTSDQHHVVKDHYKRTR